MTEIDLAGILTDVKAHTAELPADVVDCVGCHIAVTDVPQMAAEIRRLREQLFAQKPIIDAAETWVEAHEESDPEATIRATADLYGAVEQYRLMDHALTTARTEQPEATR